MGLASWAMLALAAGSAPALAQVCAPELENPSLGTTGLYHGNDDDYTVKALAVFQGELYAGGIFDRTQGAGLGNGIARWDGTSWSSVVGGVSGQGGSNPAQVLAMTVWDDGTGPALYACGDFQFVGGVQASGIAKWDGTSWSALGAGFGPSTAPLFPSDFAVFDDGTGEKLYVVGSFGTAGGVASKGIAAWDGSSWSAVPGANDEISGVPNLVEVYDDGSGPALYVGGSMTLWTPGFGTQRGRLTAKWDGASWSPLGDGSIPGAGTARANDLQVFDDGTGAKLYVSGPASFNGVSRWDGTSWEAIGGPIVNGQALEVFDTGDGPGLYSVVGQVLARWNGADWDLLVGGIGAPFGGEFNALLGVMEERGPVLYVGGNFDSSVIDSVVEDTVSVASILLCEAGCGFADCDGNGSLNIDDIDCFVSAFVGGDLNAADCDGSGVLNVDDIDCYVGSFLAGCG